MITITDAGTIGSLALSAISLMVAFYTLMYKSAKLEARMEIIWSAFVSGGQLAAARTQGAVMNSPMLITNEGRAWLGSLYADLQAWYAKVGYRLSEARLAEELIRQFGEEIKINVCVPFGLPFDAAVAIAAAAAREIKIPGEISIYGRGRE